MSCLDDNQPCCQKSLGTRLDPGLGVANSANHLLMSDLVAKLHKLCNTP